MFICIAEEGTIYWFYSRISHEEEVAYLNTQWIKLDAF